MSTRRSAIWNVHGVTRLPVERFDRARRRQDSVVADGTLVAGQAERPATPDVRARRADHHAHLARLHHPSQVRSGERGAVGVQAERDRGVPAGSSATRVKPASWITGRVTCATGSLV
jgi:hypothetical protein